MKNSKINISFISPDIEHRYIRKLGEEFLDIEFTKDYDYILKSSKPMIIWNPYGYLAHDKESYTKKYELYKEMLKNKKDVYIVERGALPNTIFIEKNYFNIESNSYNEEKWNKKLATRKNNKVKKYINWLVNEEHTLEPQKNIRISKTDFFNSLNISENQYAEIIFVPLQMHNDTVTLLWCDWVKNTSNFIEHIKELSNLYPNKLFLIKNHPCEEDNYKIVQEIKNLKIVDTLHYKDCLKYCDKVITINSGVGLQAMCWNKPVAICGKAFYQFKDINLKINNFNELVTFVEHKQFCNFEKVKRFIYYLVFKFYTECIMQKISRNSSAPRLIKTVRLPKDYYINTTKTQKLKILYLFNEYGWAFEFEANNYAKYSKHNVIPFYYRPLDKKFYDIDKNRILDEHADIIVFSSAWHYYKIEKSYINDLIQTSAKIVVQMNSHYEEKYFCKYADLIMCCNQKLYDFVIKNYDYKNVIKQHHFVDTETFPNLGIKGSGVLGWAGRFDNPIKRTDILLKLGYPILIKSNYHSFLLENRLHNNMQDFYNKIDILLITSKHEGSPYPLLEAMGCGKVVLSTDVGIASEILKNDCIITSVDEEDIISEFKEKIEYLYSNPNIIQEIGYKNYKYIKENLEWSSKYQKLDNIYRNLMINSKKETNKIIYKDDSFKNILYYLLDKNIKFWVVYKTCLDTIRFCDLKLQPNTLHLASGCDKSIKEMRLFFINNNWKESSKNCFFKNNKTIKLYIESTRLLKKMTLFGLDVNVPYPVIAYLQELYGIDWRNK